MSTLTIRSAAIALAAMPFGLGHAQQLHTALDEVVVTARKRVETLQDSDASITVLNAEAIDQARLRDVRRLDDLIPNVQFNEGGQLSNVFITIRGVESNPFIVNRAAVYIDGIPFRELTNAVLNQVESIEVLRGPQGTLYGANSESGLILLRSRAPSDHVEGEVRATGTMYSDTHGAELDGYYSLPIADNLATSLAFKVSREGSYQRNRAPGVSDPGTIREYFVQGRIRWQPSDHLTVNATSYLLDIKAPGIFDQDFYPMDRALYDATYSEAFNGGGTSGDYRFFHDAPAHTDEREYIYGLSGTYDLGAGTVDGSASYRHDRSDARGLDFDFTALPTAAGRDNNVRTVWQTELRYTSIGAEPVQYIVGTSVYDETVDNVKATFVGPGTLDSYINAPIQTKRTRDYSMFGSVNYALPSAPKITLSGGLRYDRAQQSSEQHAGDLDLGLAGVISYRDVDLSGDYSAILPRVSAKYEPTDDITLYATAAKGNIPGGFNLAAAQDGIVDSQVLRYDAETLWSYEVGFKLRSADHRFQTSGAVFYIESNNWQEIRLLTDDQGRPVSSDFIGSAASMDSVGFELEASYRPTQAFQLNGNVGYADAKYRNLFNGRENLAGNRVKLVPEYDAMLAARYEFLTHFFGRIELDFTGETQLDERNRITQPATRVVNLQLGHEGEQISIRAFVENLTDERRFSGMAFDNLAFGIDGNFYGGLEAPRVIGLELEARFGKSRL